jgi:hypothetical protein
MNATIQNDINGQLQIIGAQSIQDGIDYAYEAFRQEEIERFELSMQANQAYDDSTGPWYWEQ